MNTKCRYTNTNFKQHAKQHYGWFLIRPAIVTQWYME